MKNIKNKIYYEVVENKNIIGKGYSYSENAAYTYNVAYYKAYGMHSKAHEFCYKNMYDYPKGQSWRKLPSFINTGLKR